MIQKVETYKYFFGHSFPDLRPISLFARYRSLLYQLSIQIKLYNNNSNCLKLYDLKKNKIIFSNVLWALCFWRFKKNKKILFIIFFFSMFHCTSLFWPSLSPPSFCSLFSASFFYIIFWDCWFQWEFFRPCSTVNTSTVAMHKTPCPA